MSKTTFWENYRDILCLLLGISLGTLLGVWAGPWLVWIKPIGAIFLNLLFCSVVPLVLVALTSVIAQLEAGSGYLVRVTILVFAGTTLMAALFALGVVPFFPITDPIAALPASTLPTILPFSEQMVQLVSVSDFYELLSRRNLLALLCFAILLGTAVRQSGIAGEPFRKLLFSINEVLKRLLTLLMKAAPLGLGAFFADQISSLGSQLFTQYGQALLLGHGLCLAYYLLFLSLYAILGGGLRQLKTYWRYNLLPSATALGTCSSIATIPANLQAAQFMGIPASTAQVVIPLGASIHKEGSAISAILKIVVALSMVGLSLADPVSIFLAILISMLVSIVEGGIPNGGYVGQLLIVSVYQLPLEVLPVLMILGSLLDPVTTLLNATGDTAAGLLIQKLLLRK
ncbi:MAG: dicarboxylate/amino acid:cation symporter [Siphonobacter sp.]